MPAPVLQIEGLSVTYGTEKVLYNINLRVERGEAVAIMGPSGSGKSSLLGCITGVQRPSAGRVWVADRDMSALGVSGRARARREIMGLISQNPDLLPELTVIENVALLLLLDGVTRTQALELAAERLAQVGLSEHGHKRVDQISGGQAQRVSVARAVVRPDLRLLVADEPTAALDAVTAAGVTAILLECAHALGAGVILATHDLSVAGQCDRIIRLDRAVRPDSG